MIEEARTSLLNLQEATGLGHPTPSQVSGMVGLGTRAVDLPLGGSDTVHIRVLSGLRPQPVMWLKAQRAVLAWLEDRCLRAV